MSVLPNTTTKGADRRWPLYALLAVVLLGLALSVEAFLRAEGFSPRDEILSSAVLDLVVSEEDSLYPPPDINRFEAPPETIFVYLSVEGLPSGEDIEAQVQRTESVSFYALFIGGESDLEILDEQEDLLSTGENGARGIMKFALKTRSGEPIPPGNYTLDIYAPGATGEGEVAAHKSFVVGDGARES